MPSIGSNVLSSLSLLGVLGRILNAVSRTLTIILDGIQALDSGIQKDFDAVNAKLDSLGAKVDKIVSEIAQPEIGSFNPPAMETMMSELTLEVGQTATGKLTFDEDPPTDGAVQSGDASMVTITLDADMVTWTCKGVAATPDGAPVACTYTGTSLAPDKGPAVVPPMMVTVTAVPVAETGDFDPSGATISGP